MTKRHLDRLIARLDDLYVAGAVRISSGELLHWFELKRLAKQPWREIREHWHAILAERGEKPRTVTVITLGPDYLMVDSGQRVHTTLDALAD